MKRILISIFSLSVLFSGVFAYTPTSQDIVDVAKLNNKLGEITSGKNISLRNYYDQVRDLQTEHY